MKWKWTGNEIEIKRIKNEKKDKKMWKRIKNEEKGIKNVKKRTKNEKIDKKKD